jgi:hypothetical protein
MKKHKSRTEGANTEPTRENPATDTARNERPGMGRRKFLFAAGSAAAATPLLGELAMPAFARTAGSGIPLTAAMGRRKLGSLEVSSIGLGVQNMSRTYQTTIPRRPEMINIIRTAFDRGVTSSTRRRRTVRTRSNASSAKEWHRSVTRSRSHPSLAGTLISRLASGARG